VNADGWETGDGDLDFERRFVQFLIQHALLGKPWDQPLREGPPFDPPRPVPGARFTALQEPEVVRSWFQSFFEKWRR
jgi:hypothetical protein